LLAENAVSQIHFFMLRGDEDAFAAMLGARGDTRLVRGRFHAARAPRLVRKLGSAPSEIVLVNPAFGWPVRLSEKGAGVHRGKYCFDMFRDPHVMWHRCMLDDGALVSGSLYAKIGWSKPHDQALYRRWYEGIARWIEQTSVAAPLRAGRFRIAEGAARWWHDGNAFCFGDANALRAGPDLKHVPRLR
jgi:hypothetical protein